MRTAVVNIGTIVSGDWRRPFVEGDAILMEDERIAAVGILAANAVERAAVVIDADGTTAARVRHGDRAPRSIFERGETC
jgi:enamidase